MAKKYQRVSLTFTKPSMTDGSFAKELDPNEIMKRHVRYGVPIPVKRVWQSSDMVIPDNLQDAIDTVNVLQADFNSLPAAVRERFANDPFEMLDFIADEKNRDEAVKLGLIDKPVIKPVIEGVGTDTILDNKVPTDTAESEAAK